MREITSFLQILLLILSYELITERKVCIRQREDC